MGTPYYDILLIQDEIAKLKKRCCCGKIDFTTLSPPVDAPSANGANILVNRDTLKIYIWDGDSWEPYSSSASNGLISSGGDVVLGDDAEGITEPGVLTSDRVINQDGFAIIHAIIDRVANNVAGGGTVRSILNPQIGEDNAWNENVGSFDNAGSTTNNFVYTRGFNLNFAGGRIDPTKVGWGESWEFHYEPTTGDIFVEKHIILVDLADVQHRLDSYTIDVDDPTQHEEYKSVGNFYIKDPTSGNTFAQLQRNGTTGSALRLLGSASNTGVQFFVDAAATNLQIQPVGFAAGARYIYLDTWDGVGMPGFASFSTYNLLTKKLVPSSDNTLNIGENGARLSDVEACAIKITQPASYANVFFEVTDAGAVYLHNAPTHADEAAALAAGLTTGRVYKSADGILRVKA